MPYNLRKRPKLEEAVKPEPKSVKATKVAIVDKSAKSATKVAKSTKIVKATKVVKSEDNDKSAQDVKKEDILKTDTRLFAFGVDSCGELGLGKMGFSRKKPVQVPIQDPVQHVTCGPMHTLALTNKGHVYSFGCNDEGALGRITDGDEELDSTPTIIDLKNKVIKVTAGDSHGAVLTDHHEVFVWGNFRDEHGSVGLTPESDGQPSFKPIQICPDKKMKDIASGSNHILLLDVEGNVYSFGVGAQGSLGRLEADDAEKKKINEDRDLFLRPQKVDFGEVDSKLPFECDAIYAGNFSSFATNTYPTKKNRLASWGLNNYYQLGYKGQKGQLIQHVPRRSTFTCSTRIHNVACGQHHTVFLTRTGRVYTAGRHDYGMLGIGKADKEVCPAKQVAALAEHEIIDISAGINTSFAVSSEGKLFSWGMGGINLGAQGEEDCMVPNKVQAFDAKVLEVSAGSSFTAVIASEPSCNGAPPGGKNST